MRLGMLIGAVLFLPVSVFGFVFEDFCESTDAWDILNLRADADADVVPTTDSTCLAGFGPHVLKVTGKAMMLLPKGLAFTEGTIVALYRENSPEEDDADGVIAVWADYGMDISGLPDTKRLRAHLWFEQDNDQGLSFRYIDAAGFEAALEERPGIGRITDSWNKTNWIWQKVSIKDNRIRAKYWPAVEPEREGWDIEATFDGTRGKRIGIRINSGDMHLAYFAADTNDIRVAPPKSYLVVPKRRTAQTRNIPAELFLNTEEATRETFEIILSRGDTVVGQTRIDAGLMMWPLCFF